MYGSKSRYKGGGAMGATERDGYRFEIEYSLIENTGALHVTNTTDGSFVRELPFDLIENQAPTQDQIEVMIDRFLQQDHVSIKTGPPNMTDVNE